MSGGNVTFRRRRCERPLGALAFSALPALSAVPLSPPLTLPPQPACLHSLTLCRRLTLRSLLYPCALVFQTRSFIFNVKARYAYAPSR